MKLTKVHISDLGKIITGKTPRTSIQENYGGEIPFLTHSDDLSFKSAPKTAKTLTSLGLEEVKNCLLPIGSVSISCIGSDLGKVVVINTPTVTNQQFNSIIPNENFDTDFLYYLMTQVGKELNYHSKTSTAVPLVNKSSFSKYEVLVPNLENQRKIASILSVLDEKIELNRRINENLEEQAQALFRSWFVDFEPFGGIMPDDWEKVAMRDLTDECTTKVENQTTISVLSPVSSGELVLSDEFFTKQVYSKDLAKYIIVKSNHFAYNPARINIGSIGMNEFEFDGCVSPVYVVFKAKEGYEFYINSYIKTDYFKKEVTMRAIGGVRQTLSYKDFSLISIVKPSLSIIKEFTRNIIGWKKMKAQIDNENRVLAELRDTLLPRLMSGELKVGEANSLVENL